MCAWPRKTRRLRSLFDEAQPSELFRRAMRIMRVASSEESRRFLRSCMVGEGVGVMICIEENGILFSVNMNINLRRSKYLLFVD